MPVLYSCTPGAGLNDFSYPAVHCYLSLNLCLGNGRERIGGLKNGDGCGDFAVGVPDHGFGGEVP